jgi:hypothetical protein
MARYLGQLQLFPLAVTDGACGTARGGEAGGVALQEGPFRAACIGRRKEKATL